MSDAPHSSALAPDGGRRQFVVFQVPLLDLRPVLADPGLNRLARPTWPDPTPGVEFLRSIGGVQVRRSGPIAGWDGEPAYCDARRLVRFVDDPGTCRAPFSVVYRRLYGFRYGYRLDIGLACADSGSHRVEWLVDDVLQLRVAVGGRSEHSRALRDVGRPLALAVARSTGSAPVAVAHNPVTDCGPAVLIESTVANSDAAALSARVHGYMVPSYRMVGTRGQLKMVRRFRGTLWRMHTELEFLRGVGRTHSKGKLQLDLQALADLVASLSTNLASVRDGKVARPPLVALASGFGRLNLRELEQLADLVSEESKGLATRLRVVVERAREAEAVVQAARGGIRVERFYAKEVVMANKTVKIKASGNAVVAVDSVIAGSFNRIEGRDADLKEALADLLATVEKLNNPDATEFAEAMVQAAADEKKAVFRTSWDALKSIAPVVGTMANVAAAVARFLGGA
ncbi:hypothetical protein [Nocardioides mangrovi]|uniref:Uncharacterized protein n=1 Tax=Nocardioides mangrovi TaxID=2874580 RepID=A0ABS7U9G9_9ACTN|nr:hypothetical protein [Nocardioides mangrovi]MBZ5737520.1 hypothetical protein [Nocardioides mangrovi]